MASDSYRAVLREAIAFGLDLRHKKGCDWASPASNFQKNKPCSCGRDTLYSKLNDAAFNGVDGPGVPLVAIVAARRALFAQHAPPGYADDCETCQHLQELDEYIKSIPATGDRT